MGNGPGAGGPGGGMGPGGPDACPISVASDGKALYQKRTVTTSGSTTTVSVQLVAVGTSGSVAWTWTPPSEIRQIATPAGLVAVAVAPESSTSSTSSVVGLSLAGAQVWSTSFDGSVGGLTVTPTGLLAVVSKSSTSTGGAQMGSRSLVSLSLSGSILWTLSLD